MPHDDPIPSRQASIDLVVRFVEAVNQLDLAAIDALLGDDYALPGGGTRDDLKAALVRYRRAIPDARWVIEEHVAEPGAVVTRFLACGTHQGPLLGLPATGRAMAVAGMLISRCRGNRIIAHWILLDLLGALQQLDIVPELPLDQVVAVARVQQASSHWRRPEHVHHAPER